MHIALVHPYCWPDVRRGGERYLDDLSVHLAGAGHTVDVLTGTMGAPSVHETSIGSGQLRVRRIRHRPVRRLEQRGITVVESFGLLVLPHLLRRRYDVVHALTPTAAMASRFARQQTVYTLLGHPQPHHLSGHPAARYVGAAVRSASAVAALSQASAESLRELFGRSADVLSPGVRIDEFPPDVAPRGGPPRILFSADAGDRRKGADALLGAFQRVLETRPDARLQVSSATDWRWALDDIAEPERSRIAASVDTLGAGDPAEVPGRYRDATVTVLPSHGEAFGMVLVESLASGTPVVCNADGGMPEIVSDPSIGRIAQATDPEALSRAILETIVLAQQPGCAARCADHARRWDWETTIRAQHELLYERVARRRAPQGTPAAPG